METLRTQKLSIATHNEKCVTATQKSGDFVTNKISCDIHI